MEGKKEESMYSEKLPPHDIDAEEAVIGSLLIDGAAIYKIAAVLQSADFYYEQNQWLYSACLSLYQRSEAINQITVAQELARTGKLETCGGAAYLSHLISVCPTSLDIEDYAQIVYRLSVNRRLISAAGQIEAIGYQADPNIDASLSRAEDMLFRVRPRQGPRDFVHIRQVLDKYFEEVAPSPALGEEGYREALPYALSGFTGLDELLGGFQHSDLVIIGGRPSMGKTSLCLNIARNTAVGQAIFSLEMARDSLVLKLLSSESGVNLSRIRLGFHTEEEEERIMEATGKLAEVPIYIDDSPQLRMVEMRSKARRLHSEHHQYCDFKLRGEKVDKCPCSSGCPYAIQKRRAKEADLAVLNMAYFLNEANYSGDFSGWPWVVLDEGDLTENALMSFIEVTFSRNCGGRH